MGDSDAVTADLRSHGAGAVSYGRSDRKGEHRASGRSRTFPPPLLWIVVSGPLHLPQTGPPTLESASLGQIGRANATYDTTQKTCIGKPWTDPAPHGQIVLFQLRLLLLLLPSLWGPRPQKKNPCKTTCSPQSLPAC